MTIQKQIAKRKSRQIFVLTAFFIIGLSVWLIAGLFQPDVNGTRLSARPVPSRPHLHPLWLDIPPMERTTHIVTLKKGGNLMQMLRAQNITAITADAALDVLRDIYDPRQMKVGQNIRLFYEYPQSTENAPRFAGFDFIPAPDERVIIRRLQNGRFHAITANRPLTDKPFLIDTDISSSLYQSARANGMAPKLVIKLIRLFSFTFDLQREIREGDRLEVLYTRRFDQNGNVADEGDILFAALTNRGARKAYWRFETTTNEFDYFDAQGESLTRLLMKTPLDGARLSSRYGMRKHPILGYTRLHRGVDFAARRGTPIFAAGDGVITALGREGDWGRRIRIRHNETFTTLYAHLNGYARSLKTNDKVRQGQIIGYVGSSGLATGAHLHFEVEKNGRATNPLTLNLPPRLIIEQTSLTSFLAVQKETGDLVQALSAGLQTAAAP